MGAPERQKRNAEKHLKAGLCSLCSRKKSKDSTGFCDYHSGYQAGSNRFIMRLRELESRLKLIEIKTKETFKVEKE